MLDDKRQLSEDNTMADRTCSIYGGDRNCFLLIVPRNYDFIKTIPARKQSENSHKSWLVPATDTTVAIINQHIKRDNITFVDDFVSTLYDSLTLRTIRSEKIREQTAAYKATKLVPVNNMLKCASLSGYQETSAYNALLSEGYGLFKEQGTGKTLSAITVIDNLPAPARVAVVCPNNVRLNWVSEIVKFSQRKTKTTVIRGTQMARVSCLVQAIKKQGEDASVAIFGYDAIPGMWDALQMIEWDLVIADEAHYFRNTKTRRWEFMKRLRDKAKKRIPMTGSPIANSINDLYAQFEFMGAGYSGFNSLKDFKNFYCVYDKSNESGYSRLLDLQNVPVCQDRLSRYSFIITKKEALPDLPDKVYDIDEVEMEADQQAAYDSLANELAYEIEQELASDQNPALIIQNILTQLLKLAQVTSGFLNIPPEKGPDEEIVKKGVTVKFHPNPKLNRTIEILLAKQPHQKTIIWACFQHDIMAIHEACKQNGLRSVTYYGKTNDAAREEAERAFNFDADCRVFIGNPGAGGTGLNLLGYPPGTPSDYSVDHVIYYSQNWSSITRTQSEDRPHRRGTKNNVQVTDLCVPNSIDETIRARVVEKRSSALQITDIRQILREVFNRG